MRHPEAAGGHTGALISNADDWGRDAETTDLTLECVNGGGVAAVSSMVFMADSERAAAIAGDRNIDVGLHLNLSTPFSGPNVGANLRLHQARVSAHLRWHRLAPVLYYPHLTGSFDYLVKSQVEEFTRLYGNPPRRIDGHHHLHLCANVLYARLLPPGGVVRRNFSFQRGEKSAANRAYRAVIDALLARRHRLVDFLFVLPPVSAPDNLKRICRLAGDALVEMEVHAVQPDQHRFLASGELFRWVDRGWVRPFRSVFESPTPVNVAPARRDRW